MNPLKSIVGTIVSGFVLAIIVVLATQGSHLIVEGAVSVIICLHVFVGIIWIGLLYYFNFVQVPALAEAMASEGPYLLDLVMQPLHEAAAPVSKWIA